MPLHLFGASPFVTQTTVEALDVAVLLRLARRDVVPFDRSLLRPSQDRQAGQLIWCDAFEAAYADLDIDHRLTKPRHPWTNGQVERMNRTIKDATAKRYHYDRQDQLRQHLDNFVAAYNFGRRLKTLRGLTPYEAICKAWVENPANFTSDPHHQTPGPNI